MFETRAALAAVALLAVAGAGVPLLAQEAPPISSVAFARSTTVPGSAEAAYDAFVRVDDWWDHRYTDAPSRFLIEPWPGGRFLEQFDSRSSDGAVHAHVVWADRGRELRLEGPLGFSGSAVQIVHSLTFTEEGDSTRVDLRVSGMGVFEEGWTKALASVWDHFLIDRYTAFMEGRLD